VVARGAHLAAIREKGIVLHSGGQVITGRVRASERTADLGPQDAVIVALKAPGLGAFAAGVAPLLGPETFVVFLQNGIPWWYAQGLGAGRPRPPDLSRLDPGGALARALGPGRSVGSVVYSANTVVEPGLIDNTTPKVNQLHVAEPDDRPSARVTALRALLEGSGIEAPRVGDIRQVVWSKLLFNLCSALYLLAERPANVVLAGAGLTEVASRLIAEGVAIAAAHGVSVKAVAPNPLTHKPSILQDYELGRPMEIEAILMAPQAFARAAGVATPTLDVVAGLAALRAAQKGLYSR
jgi:2-dehydropantoate 2-reductase